MQQVQAQLAKYTNITFSRLLKLWAWQIMLISPLELAWMRQKAARFTASASDTNPVSFGSKVPGVLPGKTCAVINEQCEQGE